jgi:4-hydroxy-2-oxoheptanedioate aldolase
VDTPEQARAVVDAAKFPPIGKRSYGSRRLIDRHGRNYSDAANEQTMLIAQIESPQAIENVDVIASVAGVDALFLGPDDLLLRRGVSMTVPRNPQLLARDMETVISACRTHGKVGVMIGVGEEMLKLCMSMGFSLIVSGSDVGFLTGASTKAAADARQVIEGASKAKPTEPAATVKSIY